MPFAIQISSRLMCERDSPSPVRLAFTPVGYTCQVSFTALVQAEQPRKHRNRTCLEIGPSQRQDTSASQVNGRVLVLCG